MKKLVILSALALISLNGAAQQNPGSDDTVKRLESIENEIAKLKKLKVSGYIQAQYQWGEEDASLKVGTANEKAGDSFNRFGIRRGRIKFSYEEGIASAVFQLDITEKGVGFKDAYLNITDPWVKSIGLRAGVFDRPFGYEIGYSSSRRESPERSTVFQTLFPDERDLGAMLILQAPKSSPWSILKLEAGLFAGNGIKQETDSKKDFIGHLSAEKSWGMFAFGAGASYYNGSVYQGSETVCKMVGNGYEADIKDGNKGAFAKREYVGFDARFSVKSAIGQTQLRGEYLFGQQPGTEGSSKSPNDSKLPTGNTYIRDFNGGYVMLVQDLGKSPLGVVAKYDWYDPNTKVSGDEVGENGTTVTDLSKQTFGLGALWNINSALRLQAYYEFNSNEKTASIEGMNRNLKDDVFTLRLQYKF